MKDKLKRILLVLLSAVLCMALPSCKKKEAPKDSAMVYKNVYITEAYYSYWISCHKYTFLKSFNNGMNNDDFWHTKANEEKTYSEFTTEYVMTDLKNRTVALWLFDEYGLKLSEQKLAEIKNDINEKIEYSGSREAMNKDLAKFGLNIDMLTEVYQTNAKYDMLIDYLYGENGIEKPDDTERSEYFTDNYIAVKMMTVYSEDADAVEEKIEAGEDIDALISEYSKVDYSDYPNGIFMYKGDSASSNQSVKTAFSLDIGEHARVENAGSVNILIRCELPLYSMLSNDERELLDEEGFGDNLISEKKNAKFEALITDVKVNTDITDKYPIEKVSRNSYY